MKLEWSFDGCRISIQAESPALLHKVLVQLAAITEPADSEFIPEIPWYVDPFPEVPHTPG